jgi:hypothetical protein
MRRSPWGKRALLMLTSTVLSLALAECAVRVLALTDPVFREADPVLSWRPVANADGWWQREGRAHVHITQYGFRGVDVAPGSAPAGTLRVAVVGDSYIEARQVALEDSFGARLEAELGECAGRPVEVLAFGVSGYGTAQEYLLYDYRIRAYHPDVVVLALLTGNDLADNQPDTHQGDPPPYFAVGPDDTLVLDDSFLRTEGYRARDSDSGSLWIRRHSQLARVLHGLGGHGNGAARGELGLSDEIYTPPQTPAWIDAWARTEAIVRHYAHDVREDHARFAVVLLSNAIQVDPDPAVRDAYAGRIGSMGLLYPNARLAVAGTRDGYPVLDLVLPLRMYAEQHHAQLHGFPNTAMGTGHWNELGHRVAAEETAYWMCGTGLTAP